MNCVWKDVPGSTDENGWRKTICTRCGHVTAPWPNHPGHKHIRKCPYQGLSGLFAFLIELLTGFNIRPCQRLTGIACRVAIQIASSYAVRPTTRVDPGDVIEKMISRIGGYSLGDCQVCKTRVKQMNDGGPEWCINNIEMIVDWLRESATIFQMPFNGLAAKLLVRRSVAVSKKSFINVTARQ